jgi:hypothetical protein
MNLNYAVDRLYETGWLANDQMDCERLKDGRRYPTVSAVREEFERAGIELSIKQNLMFKCYQAEWSGGTVVGSCEKEAAVYALAQLRGTAAGQLLGVGESASGEFVGAR